MTAAVPARITALVTCTARRFRAMGAQTEVQLVHDANVEGSEAINHALDDVEARFGKYEAELSRFLATSGLTRLNNAAGAPGPQPVSALLLNVTQASLAAAAATDGMFDPTLGTVLSVLGYDRPFPLIAPLADDAVPVLLAQHRAGTWRAVAIDPDAGTIALPAGIALDFGGIGKGWTVDEMATALRRVPGVRGGLVNAGGDLRVWGMAPAGAALWAVGVEDPRDLDRDCAVMHVADRAVATSSIAFRRWQRGDRWVHHLLDPRTGRPAETDLAAVTVVGPSAMWAEVHAKVALLHGLKGGLAYLAAQDGYDGLCIGMDGTQTGTTGMGGYLQ